MSDIIEFLRARLDEDEAAAASASPGGWQFGTVESVAGGTLYDETRRIADLTYERPEDNDGIARFLAADEANANGAHIARHDPARVLREVEAKRRVILAAEDAADSFEVEWGEGVPTLRAILGPLASVYADHPDYDEAWRP